MLLRERAPAKVNLTLHVLGRREDGFHELESVVAFAGCAADALTLTPGSRLALAPVSGPFSVAAGPRSDNLVLKAARAAEERIGRLTVGTFVLSKRIPVAAGLGGGSADAGAALRLIATANDLEIDDPRLVEAAEATGSDVPACLRSRACFMAGRGERLAPLTLDPTAAVLANPLRPVATSDVFSALGLEPGTATDDPAEGAPEDVSKLVASGRNDLQGAAAWVEPCILDGLAAIARSEGVRTTRMSGSGATVFGLFDTPQAARRAARSLGHALPGWWVRASMLR